MLMYYYYIVMDKTINKINLSELEKFKLFYEHTDDTRTMLNKSARPIKRQRRTTASMQ